MKHGQKPKLLLKLLRVSTIQLSCWSLLYSPLSYADAAETLGGLNSGIQMAGQILQGFQKQQQQQLKQAQMMQQMQSLKVTPVPSKYFPQCPVIQGVTNFPEGACDAPPNVGDQAGISRIQQFKALAIDNESVFDDMLSVGQNSRTPKGIQCLKDAQANTESKLQDMVNSLQAKITQIKAINQQFKQQEQKVKEAIEKTRAELYGQSSANNKAESTKDLMKEFSPACRNFYGATGKLESNSKGFAGMRTSTEVSNSKAGKFLRNKGSYVAEVKNQISAIKNEISKNGLAFASGDPAQFQQALQSSILEKGSFTQFGSVASVVGAKISNFNRDFSNIKKDLDAVGFTITKDDLDGNFQERFSNFSKGAYDYFKKEAISKCVKGDGSMGLGLSTQQILDGLRSRGTSGSSTTLANYRTALKNILDSDAFIEDKMDAISKLDSRFGVGNIYLQIQNADAQGVSLTPYGLYQKQIETCTAKINQDDTFSTNNKGGGKISTGTYANKIARAEKAMKKALNLEKTFQNDLATSLYNRIVNCDGIQPKVESCEFSDTGENLSAITPSDKNFCIKNASSCAAQVNSCYKEVDTIVKKKKVKMQAHAQNYNALVSGVIAQQQQVLGQIKAQVIGDADYIKKYFPGASYAFPKDLLVELPKEEMVDSLGVALRGKGAVTFDQLETKLGSLVTMLQDQKTKVVEQVIGKYIADQERNIGDEAGKWKELKGKCNGAIAAYNQAVAKANEGMTKDYNKALSFCQKYTALASNPRAGCGDAADGLYKDAMNISSQYMPNSGAIKAAVIQYKGMCNAVNNEGKNKSDSSSSDSETKPNMYDELQFACEDSNALDKSDKEQSNKALLSYLSDQVMGSLPKSDMKSDDIDAITTFLDDPSKDIELSSDFKTTTYYRNTLRPIISGLGAIYDKMDAPDEIKPKDDNKDSSTIADANASIKKWDTLPFCKRYEVAQQVSAVSDCNGESTEADLKSCVKKQARAPASSEDSTIKAVARAVITAKKSVTASDSGRIGEQMSGVPCMAQQGFNGTQGNNFFSGLNQAAQSILNGGNVIGN